MHRCTANHRIRVARASKNPSQNKTRIYVENEFEKKKQKKNFNLSERGKTMVSKSDIRQQSVKVTMTVVATFNIIFS